VTYLRKQQRNKTISSLGAHERIGIGSRMRAYFFAGVLIIAPISITIYLTWLFIRFIDEQVAGLIPGRFYPETYLPFSIPGIGALIAVIFLILIGWITAGFLGRLLVRIQDHLFTRMPVIRGIYGAVKQILETVLTKQSSAFREVVAIEWPRRGVWTIGFITSTALSQIQPLSSEPLVTVFVPTTPFPTAGFLVYLPKRDTIVLNMRIEDGLKIVVSGGIVTPPNRRVDSEQDKQ
jgi:uncharacterized membrane protein